MADSKYKVGIIDNEIVLLGKAGINLKKQLEKTKKEQRNYKAVKSSIITFSLFSLFLLLLGIFNIIELVVLSKVVLFLMGFVSGAIGLFMHGFDESENKNTNIENEINVAHIELEKEIFEAKKRLKEQESELQSLKFDNSFFKKEKTING